MNTNTIATIAGKDNFQAQLCQNVRFTKDNSLNADKIGGDDFKAWKKISAHVQSYAYPVYAAAQNLESLSAPMSALIENAIKPMLSDIGAIRLRDKDGTLHDVKVEITDDFRTALATVCTIHAGKLGKNETPDLQFARSQLSNAKTQLNKYEKTNGIDPAAIEDLRKQVEKYTAEVNNLLATADKSIPVPVPAGDASFRKALEILLGRTITSQKSQTWEDYQDKLEKRRQERRERTLAKKNNKK